MRVRRLVGLAVVIALGFAAAATLLPHSPAGIREVLLTVGPLAPLILVGAWVLLTPALFPGTLLAAAGGLAFGATFGVVLAFVGAVLGGLAAFTLGRTAARGSVRRLLADSRWFTRITARLEHGGFAATLAARLMPGVPSTGLHYAAGLLPVRVRAFAAAIAIGALLRTAPYAVLGDGVGDGSALTGVVAIASIVLGALVAALLLRQLRRSSVAV